MEDDRAVEDAGELPTSPAAAATHTPTRRTARGVRSVRALFASTRLCPSCRVEDEEAVSSPRREGGGGDPGRRATVGPFQIGAAAQGWGRSMPPAPLQIGAAAPDPRSGVREWSRRRRSGLGEG